MLLGVHCGCTGCTIQGCCLVPGSHNPGGMIDVERKDVLLVQNQVSYGRCSSAPERQLHVTNPIRTSHHGRPPALYCSILRGRVNRRALVARALVSSLCLSVKKAARLPRVATWKPLAWAILLVPNWITSWRWPSRSCSYDLHVVG